MWNGLDQETLQKGALAVPRESEGFQDEPRTRKSQRGERGGTGTGTNSAQSSRNGGGRSQEESRSRNPPPPRHQKKQPSSSHPHSHPQQISTTTFVKTTKKQRKRTRGGGEGASSSTGTSSYRKSRDSGEIHPTVITTVLKNSSPFTDIQKQHNAMAEKHGLLKVKRRSTDHSSNTESTSQHQIQSSTRTPATSTSTVSDMEDTPPHLMPSKSSPMSAIKSLPLPPDSPDTMRVNRHPQSIKESFDQARDYKPHQQYPILQRNPPSPLLDHQPNSKPKQPTNIIITKSLTTAAPEQPPLVPMMNDGDDYDRVNNKRVDNSSRNLLNSSSHHSSNSLNNNNNSSSHNNSSREADRRITWHKQTGALNKTSSSSTRDLQKTSSSSTRDLDNFKGSQHSTSNSHMNTSFFGGFMKTSRRHMTKEERRDAQNPFRNRPKMAPTSSSNMILTIRQQGSSSGDHSGPGGVDDHQRRNDDDLTDPHHGSHGGMELSERSGVSVHSKTFQEKYCPLPKPVQKIHDLCGKVVTNQAFQIFMVVLIMLNALVLGIATYDFENDRINDILDTVDKGFLVVFTIELALQFGYCGYTILLDGWLVFDTLTVVTSWWLEGVQVFRSFRIFRSFRLIVRLPLLKNLVLTVFHVMPRVNSILCLLILVLYIYGVMVTVLFKDMYANGQLDQNYFGRLDYSLFTLFQMVTLEGWGDVVRQVAEEHKVYGSLIFSTFIINTGFIMYNLIVAVMCDSMLVVEQQGREQKRLKKEAKEREAKLEEQAEEARKRQERKNDPTAIDQSENTGVQEPEPPCYYPHTCHHCGETTAIPKYPSALRRRHQQRDQLAEENQFRIRALGKKVNELGQTQQKVMNVLEQLMKDMGAPAPPGDARGRRTNQG